jgi:hypothetical protein
VCVVIQNSSPSPQQVGSSLTSNMFEWHAQTLIN